MIYLNKNTNNTVILELTSNSQLLSPYFLFEFKNDLTKDYTYFNATDLSTYKCRYNRFEIIETGSTYTNYTGGTIYLIPGTYVYNIYEGSQQTLNITGTTGVSLNTGKVIVNGSDNEISSIYR